MIKHILVPVGGLPTDAALLANVFDLARPLSAHVESGRPVGAALTEATHELNAGLLAH